MYNLGLDNTEFGVHLKDRGLSQLHHVWIDPETQVVTFPLWSFGLNPALIGYQRYNWREVKIRDNGGKYFTWVSGDFKDRAVYGLDNCYGLGPMFITEGIWDALRVSNCYFDCLAVMCNTPSRNLKAHLRSLAGKRAIIALCDNDSNKSGDKLRASADMSFYPPGVKDVNELSQEACFEWLTKLMKEIR